MLWLLMLATSWADPSVSATLAADGHYTLRIVPERGWESAELSVAGGETIDLGPAQPDKPVEIEGWTVDQNILRITITTSRAGGKGTSWMMEVEPFRVPARAPDLQPRRRGWGKKRR